MDRKAAWYVLLLPLLAAHAEAQAPLSAVAEVEWQPFRAHCQRLLKGLEELKAPLPPVTVKALHGLLAKEPSDPEAAARAVQKVLDEHCLVVVSINPESRVKAARGPARPELVRDRTAA